MSLDVVAADRQLQAMAEQLVEHAAHMSAVPTFAQNLLSAWHHRHEDAVQYLEGMQQGGIWPFAIPVEPLKTIRSVAKAPRDYAVTATDGSQIEADTHGLVQCFLINVGWAAITYGAAPAASLANRPEVFHQDRDVFQAAADGTLRETGDQQLSMLRSVAEVERLAELAVAWSQGTPSIAMADGNLVRWELGGKDASGGESAFLVRYTSALARLRQAKVPVCSYISRPNAREVANSCALLAVSDCAGGAPRACSSCQDRKALLCDQVRVLPDRDLFDYLQPGQATGLFKSLAPVLERYAPDDRILFCYLRLADEVARIEVPAWVARDGHLPQVLAIVHDQCLRGRGYPVALMEAHEQAVIHAGGREAFRQLVRQALHGHELAASISGKRLSKDRRAV